MSYALNNFTGGEFGDRLRYRVDLAKYRNGCRVMENFFPMPWGGVENRPGMVYLAPARSTGKILLIPFQFNVEQAYLIEATDRAFRFFRDGEVLNGHITTPYLADELEDLCWTQSNDVLFLAHPNHPPAMLSRITTTSFRYETITGHSAFRAPFMDENSDGIALSYTAYPSGGIAISSSDALFVSSMEGAEIKWSSPISGNAMAETFTGDATGAHVLRVKGAWTLTTGGSFVGTIHLEKSSDGKNFGAYRSYTVNAERNIQDTGYCEDRCYFRLFPCTQGCSVGSDRSGETRMMKKLFSLLFLGLFSLVAQCQTWPQQLNITYVKAPFNIQNIVMKSQGLLEKEFAEEGIKINWIPIKAGLNQVRGMAAGEIDMVAAMNTSTLLIANSAGNRIVIVDGVAHPDDTFAIVAKPEVKNIVDLKGRQIVGPKGTVLHHLLSAALKNSKVSGQFAERIAFFENVAQLLKSERDSREVQVRNTLNSCVREIFKKLTTQTELDADKIQFVNDDFSLRTTYLTGGQLAVDVYSYVIGIVKALQECKMDNNENPIIVDAPFAFTGNIQSEHIFKTLPTVSKQTVLLTLDLNKIKKLLTETELYEFYVIKNDSQEKATIERGDINAIKF